MPTSWDVIGTYYLTNLNGNEVLLMYKTVYEMESRVFSQHIKIPLKAREYRFAKTRLPITLYNYRDVNVIATTIFCNSLELQYHPNINLRYAPSIFSSNFSDTPIIIGNKIIYPNISTNIQPAQMKLFCYKWRLLSNENTKRLYEIESPVIFIGDEQNQSSIIRIENEDNLYGLRSNLKHFAMIIRNKKSYDVLLFINCNNDINDIIK